MKIKVAIALAAMLSACSGSTDPDPAPPQVAEPATAPQPTISTDGQDVSALQMYVLDCGLIEISDIDAFSSAGDYAGQTDEFTDTCWLVRHPDGNFLWDLGLPTGMKGAGRQTNDVFTLSMERTISDQLVEIGLFASDIDMVSISHSHFDHTGQIDQFPAAKWLVHADEYAAMFPAEETPTDDSETDAAASAFIGFAALERQEFTGELDVFGDGSVIIIPTPGHTPGHTALLVNLPEMGPVMLTGDLYHRRESRELKRVPSFNSGANETIASMDLFEARAAELGARVIIQHDFDDIADLPKSPAPIR